MTTVFLETSALLRMLFREAGGLEVERELSGATRVTASRLIQVGGNRALIRVELDHPDQAVRLPELRRELRGIWPPMHFFEITREICDLAGRLAPSSRLRTLDAIHLATFQRAREIDPSAKLQSFERRILDEL